MNNRKDRIIKTLFLIVGILILPLLSLHAEDLRSITRLSGYWKFSIGDNMDWAAVDYDDSDWDEIHVPVSWEREGYDDYNGYAWYRKRFKLPKIQPSEQLYLVIGNIDDCDEVFINGIMIGKSGNFPPYFETAYDIERKYPIPARVLSDNGNNQLAVRVYDSHLNGGIVRGRIGIYVDEDIEYLNHNLTGLWKFKIGNEREWAKRNFDDNNWGEIQVPASWESQGYDGYDGYAWYRKDVRLPASLAGEKLYLSLGKIDDYDRVYVNGEEIGEVYDLDYDSEYRGRGHEYNARRAYEIPEGILSENSTNTISIRVYDKYGVGGIYQGPIGIMDEENYEDYHRKYYRTRGFWDYIINAFSD